MNPLALRCNNLNQYINAETPPPSQTGPSADANETAILTSCSRAAGPCYHPGIPFFRNRKIPQTY